MREIQLLSTNNRVVIGEVDGPLTQVVFGPDNPIHYRDNPAEPCKHCGKEGGYWIDRKESWGTRYYSCKFAGNRA